MLQIDMPFYEGVEDALKGCISALGGAKRVGVMLWPDKPVEEARTLLLNCLNPDRREKLDYTQLMMVFREAKCAGHYEGFRWFARECGFDASPVSVDEERDRLTTVIARSTDTLRQALMAMERLKRNAE